MTSKNKYETCKFNDLDFATRDSLVGNTQATVFFENGYGASIVRGPYTYGGSEGLYELAVCKGDADDWEICYNTPITSDVEGHLSEDGVSTLLAQIKALPTSGDSP